MEIAALLGFVLVIIDIWVIARIAKCNASEIRKATWVAVILLLPLFAHVVWYLTGPGRPD